MIALILQLAQVLAPMIITAYEDHKAGNNGAAPTQDELNVALAAAVSRIVAEGEAWKAAHPKPPA